MTVDNYGAITGDLSFTRRLDSYAFERALKENTRISIEYYLKGAPILINPGVYSKQAIPAKAGVTVLGALGTILDGGGTVRNAVTGSAANFTIQNLEVKNYAPPTQIAVIDGDGANGMRMIRLDVHNCTGVGLGVGNLGLISYCKIHDGGHLGLKATGGNNRIEYSKVYGINLNEAVDPGFEAGGSKFWATDGLQVVGNEIYNCRGPGIWFDTQNKNYLIDGNSVHECDWHKTANSSAGIFLEVSHGGIVRNNTVTKCGTEWHPWVWNAGIQIAAGEAAKDRASK